MNLVLDAEYHLPDRLLFPTPVLTQSSLHLKFMPKFKISPLNILKDHHGSLSIMATMKVRDYLKLIDSSFENRGGINGQRDVVNTTSAIRIRNRMINDFQKGTVLPPVVIGFITSTSKVNKITLKKFEDFVNETSLDTVCIIDGMQRTNVLKQIGDSVGNRLMRVEFWVANSTNRLAYRMMVLNTGQVPWNIRRQMEVLNEPFVVELRSKLTGFKSWIDNRIKPIQLYSVGSENRRSGAGQYQVHDVIEMYLAFTLRKFSVDKEVVLADQFSRLDMIEALSDDNFFNEFWKVFRAFVNFDFAFSSISVEQVDESGGKVIDGHSIFNSQPARVGFMAAASQQILGRSGTDMPSAETVAKAASLFEKNCIKTTD